MASDAKGCIVVDEATGRTGNPKVFAGGDALGGELVVTAAQDAKRAARAICALLGVTVRPDAAMNAGHKYPPIPQAVSPPAAHVQRARTQAASLNPLSGFSPS